MRKPSIRAGIYLCILVLGLCISIGESRAETPTFGILGGFSFPKTLMGKAMLNVSEDIGFDYQGSIGFFWTIQQVDLLYYFWRDEWSLYSGAGVQYWNFYGFSASTNYNGVLFGSGNNAFAATVPLGLIFISDSGFALDINVAVDVFFSAPADMKGRVIPEGQIALGYFF